MTQNLAEIQVEITAKDNLKPDYTNIPFELKQLKQWVCFALEPSDKGKPRKVPKNPFTGGNASISDHQTWGKFEDTLRACEKFKFPHIGFAFTPTDPYCGIDVDKCVNNDGSLNQIANETLEILKDSYCEYSCSGTGIHIICKGTLPDNGRKNTKLDLEVYCSKRFFVMTGNVLLTGLSIRELQPQLNVFWDKYIKKEEIRPQPIIMSASSSRSDSEIIEILQRSKNGSKFDALMKGDQSSYNNDHSSADQALCNLIAFQTKDANQIDRIFRTSKLFRKKWDDREDYRKSTIEKAISSTGMYNPQYSNKKQASNPKNAKKNTEDFLKSDELAGEELTEDFNLEEDSEDDEEMAKARANARRRALMNHASQEEIAKDICKQHSSLKAKAREIAQKAIEWATGYRPGCAVEVNGIPKTITNMESLDTRFAQLEAPGQPCVTIHRPDAQPISDKDFNKRLNGEVVVCSVDAKGQTKYTAASTYWLGNTNKKIYKKVVFTNQPVDDETYNLFVGFGVTPKEGKCDKILQHIREVICASNETNNSAFIDLLSWQIQNIGKPSRVITALKSIIQQIGKGCLLADILSPIYGNAGFVTGDIGQILTRFNDTLRGKAFIFLDEALFSGDRKAADAIKAYSTATICGIETKGIPTYKAPIAINFFLATNHDDAAHIEEADARYWILEVSPHRRGDSVYFKELYEEIENGGREAFMHYLLNRNVSGFVPWRDVPKDNAAKDAMIKNSINPYDARKWLEHCCYTRQILGYKPINLQSNLPWEDWCEGTEYENGIFFTAYTAWQKSVNSPIAAKPTSPNKFGEYLTAAGLEQSRKNTERRRTLPDPTICLEKVTKMIEKVGK